MGARRLAWEAAALGKARYAGLAVAAFLGVVATVHGVSDWRWSHADFRRLFAARIRSQMPKNLVAAFADDPADTIVVKPFSSTARLVCGPVSVRDVRTGAVTRHVYGMVMTRGLFRTLINVGYGPATVGRPDAEAESNDLCNQARLDRSK